MKQKTAAADIISPVKRPGRAPEKRRQASPPGDVVELSIVGANGSETAAALSDGERVELEECEKIIERGLVTFYEVGNALLRIREGRLFRPAHTSFKDYCYKRWNIGTSYAWRVIGAAERLKLLPGDDDSPRPANEFQMRPFLKLEPEAFPGAWKKVVRTAKGGKITTGMVRAVIRDLLPEDGEGKKKKRKRKIPVGQCLALLNEAKRHVEKGDNELVLSALERIENLLVKA